MLRSNSFWISTVIWIVFAGFSTLYAQSKTPSPFSLFYLGDIPSKANAFQIGMGGTGVSQINPYEFNPQNIASVAFLKYTSISLGMAMQKLALTNKNGSTYTIGGGPSSISLAFPIMDMFGFGISFSPYANASYSSEMTSKSENINYKGNGGIATFNIILAYKILPNWSIGLGWSYFKGSLEKTILYKNTAVYTKSFEQEKTLIKKNSFSIGSQGNILLFENNSIEWGVELKYLWPLSDHSAPIEIINFIYDLNPDFYAITRNKTLINKIGFPTKYGFGLSYLIGDIWRFSSDYTFIGAAKSTYFGNLNTGQIASIGASFLPRRNSIYNYFESITYSCGVFYNQKGIQYQQKNLSEIGASIGAVIPFPSNSAIFFTLSFNTGTRKFNDSDVLKENFQNIFMSITINESWFFKEEYQ